MKLYPCYLDIGIFGDNCKFALNYLLYARSFFENSYPQWNTLLIKRELQKQHKLHGNTLYSVSTIFTFCFCVLCESVNLWIFCEVFAKFFSNNKKTTGYFFCFFVFLYVCTYTLNLFFCYAIKYAIMLLTWICLIQYISLISALKKWIILYLLFLC